MRPNSSFTNRPAITRYVVSDRQVTPYEDHECIWNSNDTNPPNLNLVNE